MILLPSIKRPVVSLLRIRRRYVRLYAAAVPFLDALVDDERLGELVEAVCSVLPGADRQAASLSLLYLLGSQLAKPELVQLCWRLAANAERLRYQQLVLPWTCQVKPEWMACQILDIHRTDLKGPHPRRATGRCIITLRVLSGSGAGMRSVLNLPNMSLTSFATKLGFGIRGRRIPFSPKIPQDLQHLLFMAIALPEIRHPYPFFGAHTVCCPGYMQRYNSTVIKQRAAARRNCAFRFKHHCVQCNKRSCPAFGIVFME